MSLMNYKFIIYIIVTLLPHALELCLSNYGLGLKATYEKIGSVELV